MEEFLQQWEVPNTSGFSFDAANRMLCSALEEYFKTKEVMPYRRKVFTYLQNCRDASKYSAAREFINENKQRHRREMLRSAGTSGKNLDPATILVYHIRRLMIPYPPVDSWVAETQDTYTDWAEYLQTYTLADLRQYPISLDTSQL
ncbi:hypothetical protein BDZ91DRAFT_375890 [Kalaharituber pfeilii]|nr:hypothetical protein BDZ91DRAFT_375890 [Kalaharituber pfeilii]